MKIRQNKEETLTFKESERLKEIKPVQGDKRAYV